MNRGTDLTAASLKTPRPIVVDHTADSPGYGAPNCFVTGTSRSSSPKPSEFSAWVVVAELAAGAQLTWQQHHPTEAMYVESGRLEVDGVLCGAGGALIIEAGAQPTVRVLEDTRVAHFGTWVLVGEFAARPSVHVHDRVGIGTIAGAENTAVFFADSTCSTCDVTFFTNSNPTPRTSPSHHHTADEIIHVVRGELRVGSLVVSEGMSIAISAGAQYGFRTPGSEFVNFRARSSFYCRPRELPLLETVESLGATRR